MKQLLFIPFVFFLMSYTHPFAQEGSVDTDRELVEERIEKVKENRIQEERAEEVLKEEQESSEEIDRNLQPDVLIQDEKEGSVE